MTVAPQAETEVVVGLIQGIVQKGTDDYGNPNKWQVEVGTGGQNPRRLWTKDASLVQQLSMMVGQQQSFLCGISHWTNNQNQPVRSLWINGVGPAAAVPQQPMAVQQPAAPPPVAPQPQAPPMQQQWPQQQPMQQPMQQQPVVTQMGPVGESRWTQERAIERPYIHRQTASKVAAILISHVPAEQRTLDNVLKLSEQLVAYYDQGIVPFAGNPGYDDHAGDPGPQGIPVDDGIPF